MKRFFLVMGYALVLGGFSSAHAMAKKPPQDLNFLQGTYERASCNIDTVVSSWTPHTIEAFTGPNGQAKLVLQTNARVLTTRQFSITEGRNKECFADDIYTGKCKTRLEGDVLKMKVNWDCHALFLLCVAHTPKKYAFQPHNDGSLIYYEDDAVCTFRKVAE